MEAKERLEKVHPHGQYEGNRTANPSPQLQRDAFPKPCSDLLAYVPLKALRQFATQDCSTAEASLQLNFCSLFSSGVSDWRQASIMRIPCQGSETQAVFSILSDITDGKRDDVEKRLDKVPAGIALAVLGTPARIIYGNDELLRMLGCDREFFAREVMPDAMRIVHPDDHAFVRHELLAAVRESRPVAFGHRNLSFSDDVLRHFSVKAVHVDNDGGYPVFLLILLDSTKLINSEQRFDDVSALPTPSTLSSGRPSVLIVDDSGVNREILARILREEYSVLTAENGLTALSLLRQHSGNIAAVLLDIEMPVMNGHEFLEAKADIAELSNIPVIVVTGNNDSENEIRALRGGAWDFITKPYKPEIIRFRLENAILRSQLGAFDELKYLAEYDTLTGIFNKTKFFAARVRTR